MKTPNINFVKFRYLAISISLAVILAGIVLFVMNKGFNLGIDFKGGIVIRVQTATNVQTADLRSALNKNGISAVIQKYGKEENHEFLIRSAVQAANNMQIIKNIEKALTDNLGTDRVILPFKKTDLVGPTIGAYITKQSFWLIIISLALIMVYIAVRFEFVFSIAAVVALLHDVLIVLAFLLFTNKELTVPVIAAILTIIGYSLNDTIVVFDRIREDLKKYRTVEYSVIINRSINETLQRTIVTSLTTLFAVLSLYFFGGPVLKDFSFSIFIGILSGTYSSIFIASPVLIQRNLHKAIKEKKEAL